MSLASVFEISSVNMTQTTSQWLQRLHHILLTLTLLMSRIKCDFNSNLQCDCVQFESTFGKEYGVFMSPDWPAPYEHQKRCLAYIFHAPPNHIVELTFDEFDLQRRDAG